MWQHTCSLESPEFKDTLLIARAKKGTERTPEEHTIISCSKAQESTSSCLSTHSVHDTARYRERINQYDADLVTERGSVSSHSQARA